MLPHLPPGLTSTTPHAGRHATHLRLCGGAPARDRNPPAVRLCLRGSPRWRPWRTRGNGAHAGVGHEQEIPAATWPRGEGTRRAGECLSVGAVVKISQADVKRFSAKYERISDKKCWNWIAGLNHYGYGHFMLRHPKRMARAHRVAYQIYKGRIAKGKMVLHTCDNRACVNPKHLVVGTQLDNMQHCLRRQRFSVGVRHWRAKLTPRKVRSIRKDMRKHAVIGALYGVSASTISDIKRFRYWVHVS